MATYNSTKFIADIDGKIYLKSQHVSVYPSAYRGDNGAAPTPRVFDPEARLNTEKNIITHSFLSANKSYIIAVGNFGIKCIIGGYYFKLDLVAGDFGNEGDVCFANIKLSDVQLTTGTNTQILGSWINPSNLLDSVLPAGAENSVENYVFSGIYFSSEADDDAAASLAIATKVGERLQPSGSIAYTEIQSAYNYLDTADNTKKTASITGNLVDGAATVGGVKIDGAIAGIYKSASKYIPNLSGGESATALGINTVAEKAGELVVGKYNTIENNTLFIVGNGTANNSRANAFTVYDTGDAKIARDLTITRNLTVTDTIRANLYANKAAITNSKVNLADSGVLIERDVNDANNANSALIVNNKQGAGNIVNFQFDSADKVLITKDGDLTVAGGADIGGELTVNGATAITGALEIGGNTTLGNNVAEDLTTIKGLAVIDGKTGANDLPLTIKNGSAVNFSVDSAGNISLSGDIKSSDNAFTIQSLNTNNKIAFDGSGSGNITMQAGDEGNGKIKLLSYTYFGIPGSTGVSGKYGSLFLYNRNSGSAKTTELYTAATDADIRVTLPDGTTTFIAGTYQDSATTANSVDSVKNTLVKRDGSKNVYANAFYASSDERLKENIIDYKYHNSILEISVKEFDYKETGVHAIGFIAQELQEKFPELVNTSEDGYLSIAENKLVYLLLEEVKLLKEEVKALREVR